MHDLFVVDGLERCVSELLLNDMDRDDDAGGGPLFAVCIYGICFFDFELVFPCMEVCFYERACMPIIEDMYMFCGSIRVCDKICEQCVWFLELPGLVIDSEF